MQKARGNVHLKVTVIICAIFFITIITIHVNLLFDHVTTDIPLKVYYIINSFSTKHLIIVVYSFTA